MAPMWIILVVMCMVENGKVVSCNTDTGNRAFESEAECKEYASKNYNPVPSCIQPLTIFYEKEKKP
jgi:hypothetical protein